MARGPLRLAAAAGQAIRKITLWTSGAEADVSTSPTITAGAGAPSASEVDGSLYCRTDGDASTGLYLRDGSAWAPAGDQAAALADPGTGVAIPVTRSATIAITTAAAETNTLAIPTFAGQVMNLICDVYAVGDRVITASVKVNQAANTVLTFGAAGDFVQLTAVQEAGTLRWQVTHNDGMALS